VKERGFTLFEIVVAVAVVLAALAIAIPNLKAYSVEAHILGAGRAFKGEFRRARSIAAKTSRHAAIRFEVVDGVDYYSVYSDGGCNGILKREIDRGVDIRIAGPIRLDAGAPGVRVGINPGVSAIPPDRGILSGDPIRFGSSRMVSFSPLGTATPGTFYLAGENVQAAVRVTPGSARVRMMFWRGGRWVER
jgi:prepilin-type N-terminal cleavage/methylation domain-containing protein